MASSQGPLEISDQDHLVGTSAPVSTSVHLCQTCAEESCFQLGHHKKARVGKVETEDGHFWVCSWKMQEVMGCVREGGGQCILQLSVQL